MLPFLGALVAASIYSYRRMKLSKQSFLNI
jgi:hypothetical protein